MDNKPLPGWLRPLWVRVLFCILPLVWSVFEFTRGDPTWGGVFVLLAAWGVWSLILRQRPRDE